MSYSGSQQQFGFGDLQLLQQHVMLARQQELQKQQQLGQFGDVKPQSSFNHMSLFAKQASGSQIHDLGSGTPLNASQIFAGSNINWMHRNVSSPVQGTCSYDQGLMMNPALLQPDVSLYGTPIGSGRGNLGQYSPLQGVSHCSISMLSAHSEQKPITQVSSYTDAPLGDRLSVSLGHLDDSFMVRQGLQEKGSVEKASIQMINSGVSVQSSLLRNSLEKNVSMPEYTKTHGQSGCTGFLLEQNKQTNESQGVAMLDPLEEKILFHTEDSGWDTSFSMLAAMGTGEVVSTLDHTEPLNSFPPVQSGSWSALMQSAVAEASSSDTGVQEELSGLSFQNTELSMDDNQTTNFVTSEQQHVKCTDSMLQSSSCDMTVTPSSCEVIMSSAFPCSSQRGPQLTCEQAAAGKSIEEKRKQSCRLAENQLQLKQSAPARHLGNDRARQDDQSSKGDEQVQNAISENCWPADVTEAFCKNPNLFRGSTPSALLMSGTNRNSHESIQQEGAAAAAAGGNGCMPVADDTMVRKKEMMGHDHYQLSSSPMAPDTPYMRAVGMHESQTRYKGENSNDSYIFKVSQPYTTQPASCFNAEDSESSARSNQKSSNQVKANLSVHMLSKGSQASDISVSLDSQYTSKFDKDKPPKDDRSAIHFNSGITQTELQELDMPNVSVSQATCLGDRFSFQSSVQGYPAHANLGNCQKGETWWMPSCIGQPVSPLRGASIAQSLSDESRVLGHSGIGTSNLNCDIGQYIPLSVTPQDSYLLSNITSSSRQYSTSGALPIRDSQSISDSCHQSATLLDVRMNVSNQRDLMNDSCKVSSSCLVDSDHQQGNIKSDRSSTGTTSRAIQTFGQPEQSHIHILENVKEELDSSISATDMEFNSATAVSSLNKQQIPELAGQQLLHETNMLGSNIDAASQFNSCLYSGTSTLAFSARPSSTLMGIASSQTALQYVHSNKVPMFSHSGPQGLSDDDKWVSDRIRQLHIRGQLTPTWYKQYECFKNGQKLYLCDSTRLTSGKPSEDLQVSSTRAHVNAIDGSRTLPNLAYQGVRNQQLLPSSVHPPDVANIILPLTGTKKRKIAMYDCLPWHKEVTQTCRYLPQISIAEQEWAEATNRLREMEVDEGEISTEMRSPIRAKKRLILTTQLMQQVFRPPPSTVLSVDAATDYEIVAYFVAKLALADACNVANKTSTHCDMTHQNHSTVVSRPTNAGTSNHLLLGKATEDLFNRAKKLESHVDRLDRSVSVVDVRVECQELEKFCVINHFAKYHGRLVSSAATDSGISSRPMTSVRSFLQRYGSAAPLPQKLPEGVQCLSL